MCSCHVKKRGTISLSYLGDTWPSCSLAFNGSSVDGSELLAHSPSSLRPQLVRARTLTKLMLCVFSSRKKKRGTISLSYLGDTWLEHVTPTMSMWCATNCANRPRFLILILDFWLAGSLRYLPPSFRYLIEKRSPCQSPALFEKKLCKKLYLVTIIVFCFRKIILPQTFKNA